MTWGIEERFFIEIVALCGFTAILIMAIVFDLRYRRIPNWLNISLLALWVIVAVTVSTVFEGAWQGFVQAGLVAFIVLLVAIGLFFLRVIGGGDAKMLASVALWLPAGSLLNYLVAVILAGGVVSFATLLWSRSNENRDKRVPYGIAIAFGGVWVCAQAFFSAK